MKESYWIEVRGNKDIKLWYWVIKAVNGRIKARSWSDYKRKSLCRNDAHSLADKYGIEVRE